MNKSYMIRFCYDGTNYSGYQRQANSDTVGEHILSALTKIFGGVYELAGCSRTDSGVHALDYCASFKSEKDIDPQTVIKAMNSNLPKDISVFDCRYTDNEFHARYSVVSKEYVYLIYNGKVRSPFYDRYVYFYPYTMDINKLSEAASVFIGRKDFKSFMAAGGKISDTVRTVIKSEIVQRGDLVEYHVAADGFLYNMVRIMTGTLINVAQNKISVSRINDIINERSRESAGFTAPAKGLFLFKVNY